MNRIEAGIVKWRNPFGGREIETSLKEEDIAAIVFWSKNYGPMLPYLPKLHKRGYRFIFHFTITGLPQIFEPSVPPAEHTIITAKMLAEEFGAETVLWRYDPIVISSITDAGYHRRRFEQLAAQLEGYTRRCYISFPTFYGKVIRNTASLYRETGVTCINIPMVEKIALVSDLADMAEQRGISLFSCCNDMLVTGKIAKASCIDARLLMQLYPQKMIALRHKGTRKECGCYESTDIGAYDTCPHGCVYCYANINKDAAIRKWQAHDAHSLSL